MRGGCFLVLLILPALTFKLHKLKHDATLQTDTEGREAELRNAVAQLHEERARLIQAERQSDSRLLGLQNTASESENGLTRRNLFARAAFNKAMGRSEYVQSRSTRSEKARKKEKELEKKLKRKEKKIEKKAKKELKKLKKIRKKAEKRAEQAKKAVQTSKSRASVFPTGQNLNLNLNMKLNMKIPTSALKRAGKYRLKKREAGVSDSEDSDDDDSEDDDSEDSTASDDDSDEDDSEDSVGEDDVADFEFEPQLESMTLTEGYGDEQHVIADLMNMADSSEEDDEVALGDSASDDLEDFEGFDSDDDELQVSSIPHSLGALDEEDVTDLLSYFFSEHEDTVGMDFDSSSEEKEAAVSEQDPYDEDSFDSQSEDTYFVSGDPEDIFNEIAVGDSGEFDQLSEELLDEQAVGEEQLGSWPEALLWEETRVGDSSEDLSGLLDEEDDLSDLLNDMFVDEEEEVGEPFDEANGLLGMYQDSSDEESVGFRRRLLSIEEFSEDLEDIPALSSFYLDDEEPLGDSSPFAEVSLGEELEASLGEQRIIDALQDLLDQSNSDSEDEGSQWDMDEDDDEDEELVASSEDSEDLIDVLENFLRENGEDFSSDESAVGEDEMDLDKIIAFLEENDEEREVGSSDPNSEDEEVPVSDAEMTEEEALELLELYLKHQGSEEAVGDAGFESDMMLRQIQDYLLAHDDLLETAVGDDDDSDDDDDELQVGDFYDPLFGFEDDLELEPFDSFDSDEEIAVGDSYEWDSDSFDSDEVAVGESYDLNLDSFDLDDSLDFESSEFLVGDSEDFDLEDSYDFDSSESRVGDSEDLSDSFESSEDFVGASKDSSSPYESDDIDLDKEEEEAKEDLEDSDEAISESDSYASDDSEVDMSESWDSDSDTDSDLSDDFSADDSTEFADSEDSTDPKKKKKKSSESEDSTSSEDSTNPHSSSEDSSDKSSSEDSNTDSQDSTQSSKDSEETTSSSSKDSLEESSADSLDFASGDSSEVPSASKEKSPTKHSKAKESAAAESSDDEVSDYHFDQLADEPLKTPEVDPKDELDEAATAVSSLKAKPAHKSDSSSSSEEVDDSKPSSRFSDGFTGLDSMDGDKPETVF